MNTLLADYMKSLKKDRHYRLKMLILHALESLQPTRGEKGLQGNPGKDGFTPVKGVDYLTTKELKKIKSSVTPLKGVDYYTTEDIKAVTDIVYKTLLDTVPSTDLLKEFITIQVEKKVSAQTASQETPLSQKQVEKIVYQIVSNIVIPTPPMKWGQFTGNIEDQTDLVSYVASHGGGGAIPTKVSDLENDLAFISDPTPWIPTNVGSFSNDAGYLLPGDIADLFNKVTDDLDDIAEGTTAKKVNQTEKDAWNGKQTALGFTPEDVSNKKTSLADNSDSFYPTQKAVKTAVDAKQNSLGFTPENSANKDQVNGYPGLDAGGKINPAQLPSLAIGETFTVASQVAMLALTAQVGDIAIRTDESKTYILNGSDPTVLGNWVQLLFPAGGGVTSVFSRTGVVTAQLGDYDTSKVTEVTDKKYVTDAEKTKLSNLSGTNTGDQVIPDQLSDLTDDATHRVVTDAEKTAWNAKQSPLTADVDYLTPATAGTTYEPKKGTDDNFVTDAEKTKLSNLSGTNTGDQTIPDQLSDLSEDTTHRTVTDTEKSTWNGKQSALGFTPENVSNKAIILTTSNDSLYPSVKAVVDALAGKQASGSYEVTTNKENSTIDTSTTKYPTVNLLKTGLDAKQSTSEKNNANGYAGLGADGKISSTQLPAIAITTTSVVASQVAMLALTAETGDVAIRSDLSKTFILSGTDPTNLAHWTELSTPTDTVTSVNGMTGAVTVDSDDIDDTGKTHQFTTATEASKLAGIEASADVTDAGNVGSAIHGVIEKTPPLDADTVPLIDTGASNVLKKITFANIKAFLKTYFDTLYNNYVHPNHSGDVTSVADGATTIANGAVSLAKMANMATASLIYRKTGGAGAPEVNTLATLKTDLGLSGTNSGDQTTVSGNAGTATALQTPRAINGINFDGSAPITISTLPLVEAPANQSYNGITVPLTYGESIVPGDLLYFKNDGKVWKADANSAGLFPVMGLALETASSGAHLVLLNGIFRDDARYAFTVGGAVYLSTTAGAETQTQPSATDDVIQVVGIALHADRILFNPSLEIMAHI